MFEHIIGQKQIKKQLTKILNNTIKYKDNMPTMLFYGLSGCGKTELAKSVADELHLQLKTVYGDDLTTLDKLSSVLDEIKGEDILFIDEAHRMPAECQLAFFKKFDDVINSNSRFNFICATNELYKLKKPFVNRFTLQFKMEEYDAVQLTKIIMNFAKENYDIRILWNACYELAKNSGNTPRTAITLLRSIYLFFRERKVISEQQIKYYFTEVSPHISGLTLEQVKLLDILSKATDFIPLYALAAKMDDMPKNISNIVEPYLLKLNYIERVNSKGRKITPSGINFLKSINR